MDLNKLFDDYFEEQKEQNSDEVVWEEDPVTFKEFIASSEHMNFPPYSQRQLDVFDFMFGDEPKKIFENEHSLAVLAWGKGGFKKDKVIADVKTGESHTIEEWSILDKAVNIYSYDFNKNKKVINKIKPFKEGTGAVYKIITDSNKEFIVDSEHKFYTDKFVYQKIKELFCGSKIYCLGKQKQNTYNYKIEVEERKKQLLKCGYNFVEKSFEITFNYNNYTYHYIPSLLVLDKDNANLYIEEFKQNLKYYNLQQLELIKQEFKRLGFEFHVYGSDFYNLTKYGHFESIKSIEYVGEDDFYGFCSPVHKNIIVDDVIHHNSGKDTVSCHATLYVVYVLLCCKNPTKLFKGVTADYLDILNVAYNHRQSVDVFMAKLILAVKNWKWLKKKYKYVDSGKSIKDDKKYESTDVVNIKQDRIIFPKYIRAMAKCSQQDAAEGTNLLVWIADEFSAFSDKNSKSNAIEMFETLRTSSTTRFQNYGKGFVISFTRYKNDPILKLIDQYKDDINAYCDIASTFDVKPRSAFKGEWGEWNGIEMPKSFIPDFEKNPEGSKAKYLCQPPDAEDPWITETVFIDESFNERVPMFEFSETTKTSLNGNMIIKDIVRKNFNIPDKMFVIAGDIGLTTDRTVITMWHDESMYLADGSVIKKYVQDFTLSWVPNKAQNRKVDVNNVEYIIKKILFEYKIPVSGIYFDHFSSIQLLDELANKGIVSQQHTLKVDDFAKFKILLYSRSLDFIKESVQEEELRRLVNGKDGKPDHPDANSHDDTFRANCMAISALEGFGGNDTVVTEDGIFLKGKKSMNTHLDGSNIKGDTVKTELHSSGAFKDDDIFAALNSVNGLK